MAEMNPERLLHWAESIGLETKRMVAEIMTAKKYPEQGYLSCLGVLNLGKKYGNARVEKACHRALKFHSIGYGPVKSILEKGLEDVQEEEQVMLPLPVHENIRGSEYFK